ncbi:MAG: ISAs1 family transposase [Methylomonas lenta]|nr:ISAs1 family transposase [Methylomonas lenta]
MGCQKKIAEQIIQRGGDYVLSLKGSLLDDVSTFFNSPLSPPAALLSVDGDHGRIETRTLQATDDIAWLRERHDWVGFKSIMALTVQCECRQKVSTETRYFISSLAADDPQRLGRAVRAHWSIENNLHWVLDVAFDEDHSRTRKGHSAANLSTIRHIALNLIKNEKSCKVGIKVKRKRAGWDNDYLLRVIGGI